MMVVTMTTPVILAFLITHTLAFKPITRGSQLSRRRSTNADLRESTSALRDEVDRLKEKLTNNKETARLAAFRSFDTNSDGGIDRDELSSALKLKYGITATLSDLDRVFLIFDENQSGKIEFEEFKPFEMTELVEKGQLPKTIFPIPNDDADLSGMILTGAKEETIVVTKESTYTRPEPEGALLPRLTSCLFYVLPLLDSVEIGRRFMSPSLASTFESLLNDNTRVLMFPLFFLIYFFGTKKNMNPLIRFNALQAVQLDVFVVTAAWGQYIPIGDELHKLLDEPSAAAVCLVLASSIFYSAISSAVFGTVPDMVPFISDSVKVSVRQADEREEEKA